MSGLFLSGVWEPVGVGEGFHDGAGEGDPAAYREQVLPAAVTGRVSVEAAITKGDSYREQLAALAARGADAETAVFEITTADVAESCELFAPVAAATKGVDGRVSIEVDPRMTWDTSGTIAAAKRLYAKVGHDNVFIKIPATLEGLESISATLAEGISVNVTLIFSLERYRAVINALLIGLERAKENGHDLSTVHSVASFFVSRVDLEIDKRLDAIGGDEAKDLKGEAGLANARLAYQIYQEVFSSERWKLLADAGALPQRPLWASAGVKDPAYPDTMYVTGLVAAGVVNTMPEKTLDATFDHGVVTGDTITVGYDEANMVLDELEKLGVSYQTVVAQLETDGLDKFVSSWKELLELVQDALDAVTGGIKA